MTNNVRAYISQSVYIQYLYSIYTVFIQYIYSIYIAYTHIQQNLCKWTNHDYKQGDYHSQLFPPFLLYCDPQLLCTHALLISSNFGHGGPKCNIHLRRLSIDIREWSICGDGRLERFQCIYITAGLESTDSNSARMKPMA